MAKSVLHPNELQGRLAGLLRGVGARGDLQMEAKLLLDHWWEPHRHYHNVDHLVECLLWLDSFESVSAHLPMRVEAVEMALFWHDAVYKTTAWADNEADSAAYFMSAADRLRILPAFQILVRDLILATRHTNEPTEPVGSEAQLVVDIDLARLAAEPLGFDSLNAQVRREYAQYPDEVYNPARVAVLQALLARPIYHTGFFKQMEAQAQSNLRSEIKRLEGSKL